MDCPRYKTPKVDQLTTVAADLYVHEHSSSLSFIKKNWGDCASTTVEKGSVKHVILSRDAESEALTPFFRFPTILPSRVPITLEEFAIGVATEDLAFVQNQFVDDILGLFVDASYTLSKAEYLISMVAAGQDDVLGFGEVVREREELKKKCETLARENSKPEEELVELWKKVELVDSLQEKVKQYSSLSALAAKLAELKASLNEGVKYWKKTSEGVAKA
ncbi:uncharacterized protein LOC127096882 [Lathyrus oleraceus]|uniref:uncharacterized protein LOC127096882 n=1 Tax=Pisum sativum TaxID=3888 RepID=UPI0021D25F63|nr:uncharacterized protein LOC127096882 [Pisum sativum]